MNKENFSDRVDFYKQQNESKRLADITSREQKQHQEKEKTRQEEINLQREIIEKVAKTKEIFKGTGILETFQEIVNERILLFAKIEKAIWGKSFFDKNKLIISDEKEIPAKILFNNNEVNLVFGVYFHSDEYGCGLLEKKIKVTKNETTEFGLSLPFDDFKLMKDSNEVIDNIANFVSIGGSNTSFNTFSYGSSSSDYGYEIIERSRNYDKESGIFETK